MKSTQVTSTTVVSAASRVAGPGFPLEIKMYKDTFDHLNAHHRPYKMVPPPVISWFINHISIDISPRTIVIEVIN